MPISLRLPDDVEARLKNLAAQTGRSKTFYATEAICEYIDDLAACRTWKSLAAHRPQRRIVQPPFAAWIWRMR